MSSRFAIASVLSALTLPSLAWSALPDNTDSSTQLEEVIVTATFRAQSLLDTPASVTVLNANTLSQAGNQHFQDVLGLVPNLNWAGGSSRPRYFQIRGIGEREQYEGAPNPSVGFLIDDIDFSGLGMAATLFDVEQIEVLRGPQGTRYGANALAGLINVRTQSPGEEFQAGAQASMANYHTNSVGAYLTTPVESLDSSLRLAVQQYHSDGFMKNAYLHRTDTNDRDELSARLKWHWRLSDTSTLDATVLHANLDNGYDAWAIDNSRTSLADEPGKDSQRATGAALKLVSDFDSYTLTATGSTLASQSVNSFDADWGNAQSWSPYTYSYFMRSDRDLHNHAVEVRVASRDAERESLGWLVGVYALRTTEAGRDDLWGQYADPGDPVYVDRDALTSDYHATNLAVFGQLEGQLPDRWRWTVGLRGEQRTASYQDHNEVSLSDNDLSARDRMVGGQVSLQRELHDKANAYLTLSRGYKSGGFNLGSSIDPSKRYFAPETLWSSELGYKATITDRLQIEADIFYQWRRDLQMRTGVQADPSNPGTYVFLTTNAARGYNTGVEANLSYRLATQWQLGGTLGLLRTRVSGARDADGVVAPEREQAHAPEYTASAFVMWRSGNGWMARLDVQAKDNFYFDIPTDHNQQSHAYSLTNIKAGYEAARWSLTGWVNNAFDADYAIRGFYFSNEPPNWEQKLYTQKGDPRQVGVTGSWKF